MKIFKHIIATVPQGVGDIFWCYQKLKPHCEKISFRIAVVGNSDPIQSRAENIIASLPDVLSVSLTVLNRADYAALINGVFDLSKIQRIRNADEIAINYSVNKKLDNGVRLEDIDQYPVMYDIDLVKKPSEFDFKYAAFYVSGSTSNSHTAKKLGLWDAKMWASIIKKIKIPVVLIGAKFDKDIMYEIKKLCPEIQIIIQLEPERLFSVIGNASFFVGYQSGLNILADNLGVKQLIVYFDHLEKMKDSWVHPDRRETHFNYCYFSEGIKNAIEIIETKLCT